MEQDFLIVGVSALALTIGLTQVVKKWVENRWTPLVAILIGIGLSVVGSWSSLTSETIVRGIIIGLVAGGVWDVGKRTVLNK